MAKIGIYTCFPAYIGGGERYIMTFANALQQEHEVSFLCGSPLEYQKLSKILNIDTSKINFVEFHGGVNLKKILFNNWFDQQNIVYDVFVAMSNHITPSVIGLGRKNILHIQFPYPCQKTFNIKTLVKQNIYKYSYDLSVVNSKFTKSHVIKKFKYPLKVIYPPVATEHLKFTSYNYKKNQIISVGRFIGTQDSKRQLEMVRFFKKLCDLYPDLDVEYLCVGGERPEKIHQDYISQVQQEAEGYPIKLLLDTSLTDLAKLYSETKVFWHAKGYGVDEKHPEFTEHFGISTVEAMFSGCIPIVFKAGGQLEIVQDEYNGFLWRNEQELIQKTAEILRNYPVALSIAQNAHESSLRFSSQNFKLQVRELIVSLLGK